MKRTLLREMLDGYALRWPEERSCLRRFREFVEREPGCFDRRTRHGHVTGSAWIVDPGGAHVLLLHHRKLDRWLQPGGHADGDPDPRRVALKETEEETGLRDLQVEDLPFDLDIHAIPARGEEPEHFHYDVRFRLVAGTPEEAERNHESRELRWFPVEDLLDWPEESIARMARKERG